MMVNVYGELSTNFGPTFQVSEIYHNLPIYIYMLYDIYIYIYIYYDIYIYTHIISIAKLAKLHLVDLGTSIFLVKEIFQAKIQWRGPRATPGIGYPRCYMVLGDLPSGYVKIAIEHGHLVRELSHETW